MIIERIDELMAIHGIASYAECERSCGLANGTIGKWKKGLNKPSIDYLLKIADFFNVSADYLLAKTDAPTDGKESDAFEELKDALENSVFKDTIEDMTPEQRIEFAHMLADYMNQNKESFEDMARGRGFLPPKE